MPAPEARIFIWKRKTGRRLMKTNQNRLRFILIKPEQPASCFFLLAAPQIFLKIILR
jgi:hypothetical protein